MKEGPVYDPTTHTHTTHTTPSGIMDASTLGLPPGRWPYRIEFEGVGTVTRDRAVYDGFGALAFVEYTGLAYPVKVFND